MCRKRLVVLYLLRRFSVMRSITLNSRNTAIDRVVSGLDNRGDATGTGFPKLDKAMGGGLYPFNGVDEFQYE